MLKFDKIENSEIEKKYPRIYRYIKILILKHKNEFPKILNVKIYCGGYNYDNSTCLKSCGIYPNQKFDLNINLRQLLEIYNKKSLFDKTRIIPEKIKGFRKYILFVIFHELGHYSLGHHKNYFNYINDKNQNEINCDLFSYNKILSEISQLEFDFINKGGG